MFFTSVSGHVFDHTFEDDKYNKSWNLFDPKDLLTSARIKYHVTGNSKNLV